jgi:hypothetical protein
MKIGTPVVAAEVPQDRPNLIVRPAGLNEPAIGTVGTTPFARDAVHGLLDHAIAVAGIGSGRSGGPFAAGAFLVVGPDGRLVDIDAIDEPVRYVVAQAVIAAERADQVVAVRLMASVLGAMAASVVDRAARRFEAAR